MLILAGPDSCCGVTPLKRDSSLTETLKPEAQGFTLRKRAFSFREALKTRQFWTICFTNLTIVFSLMIIFLHIVPHAMDIGYPATTAAGILSTIAGASMVGRLFMGIVADRRESGLHDRLFLAPDPGFLLVATGE